MSIKALRFAAGMLALALVVGACAGGDAASVNAVSVNAVSGDSVFLDSVSTSTTSASIDSADTATTSAPPAVESETESADTVELSPLAAQVRSAGNLRFDPEAVASGPQPVWVDIESIGVSQATVLDVGVEPNGELEVPGASDIGWYRWSPTPGEAGSAVLAAHIAYNGTDGVFRYLDDVEVGALLTIGYDDGSVREFEIIEKSQYGKDQLPFDRVFAKDGDPVVALITCGGTFNPALNSYEDNVVAYAIPR